MVSIGALKIPKGGLTLWLYIPSHASHPWQGSDEKVSLISFETNINALQEPNASGKSNAAPLPDHPDKWETVIGEVLYFSFEKTGDYS